MTEKNKDCRDMVFNTYNNDKTISQLEYELKLKDEYIEYLKSYIINSFAKKLEIESEFIQSHVEYLIYKCHKRTELFEENQITISKQKRR